MTGTILLLGGDGQVGWELRRTLPALGHVVAPDRAELDLGELQEVRGFIRDLAPDLVVNAAAYTAVDDAETNETAAFRLNAELPGLLAEEARHGGIPLVHYSTDYVFDGVAPADETGAPRAYRETDPTNPLSVYGRSKLAGEIAVMDSGAAALTFRTAWVYSARRRNFMMTMRRLAAQREELRVVDDQIGSPTWARQIAQTSTMALAGCWNFPGRKPVSPSIEDVAGIYHLTAGGQTSWFGFASAIVELARSGQGDVKTPKMVPIPASEYPTPARRPAWSVLDNARLLEMFALQAPSWRDQLDLCIKPDQ